jgi:hypothetical protein
MISRKMENHIYPFDRSLGYTRVQQVVMEKLDSVTVYMLLDVSQSTAAQIIYNAHLRTPCDQGICEVRPNK